MLSKIASNYLEKIAKDFYNSIVHTETGSFKDPWIRTTFAPPEGSSAYGPAQLTKTKVVDYFNRFPKRMAQHAKFYNNVLKPMHENFLKYGREPNKAGYDKKWDYGGKGNPLTDLQKQQYEKLARTMMAIDEQEARRLLPNGTPEQILNKRIALWRGAPQSNDKRYYKDFHSVYNKSGRQDYTGPEPLAYPMEMEFPDYQSTTLPEPKLQSPLPEPRLSNMYTVKNGDILSRIVTARGITGATNIYNMVNKIKKINNLNNDKIKPGQTLILPDGL